MKYEIVGAHDAGGVTRALMILDCGQKCQIPLRQGEAKAWVGGHVWGWDGKQTVTPSIACSKCGFHKTLTNGEWQ